MKPASAARNSVSAGADQRPLNVLKDGKALRRICYGAARFLFFGQQDSVAGRITVQVEILFALHFIDVVFIVLDDDKVYLVFGKFAKRAVIS